jgi:electron transport complex protein RnfG
MATPNADPAGRLPARLVVLVAALVALAIVAAVLAGLAQRGTRDRIADNERRDALAVLESVLPDTPHDNDLLADTIEAVDEELLGSSRPHRIHIARLGGAPAGVVMEVTARGGYGGPLELLVGIRADGSIAAVRVLAHRETPGIGDGVERRDWLSQFDGHSLVDPPPEDWLVKRDGGAFDEMTGATITPRAVVKGAYNALLYYRQHEAELFATASAPAPSS